MTGLLRSTDCSAPSISSGAANLLSAALRSVETDAVRVQPIYEMESPHSMASLKMPGYLSASMVK